MFANSKIKINKIKSTKVDCCFLFGFFYICFAAKQTQAVIHHHRRANDHQACYTKGQAGSPHLVDVLGTLHGDLGQSGDVELAAAVGIHLYVEFVRRILPEQVPEGNRDV